MNTLKKLSVLGLFVVGLSACGTDPKSAAGFTLPEGDVKRGKAAYVEYGCNACHQHSDVPQLESALAAELSVPLGGETARVRTYGELVTSVINPSHRIAKRRSIEVADETGNSKMVTFNDVMTVTQLIDMVAFLQESYELSPHHNTVYPVYWHPEAQDK
ncbi:c-type cytochrome [Pseudohalioglobus lutimaris]|uniref:Cytochrome C n=1 Tax=Pseudohalioglobus lutimaris TaxID=1737061 RepID=A0A2N5X8C6_9GAMM|nr:c-type cytochrome [Pseudohalioglobus lutimaris]PLW70754.1 cytochrome C [Pseudohalioglobus lutimaris]